MTKSDDDTLFGIRPATPSKVKFADEARPSDCLPPATLPSITGRDNTNVTNIPDQQRTYIRTNCINADDK